MAKRKNVYNILASAAITLFLGAIAWTNETVDYLAKIGINNVHPGYVFLITSFLFVLSSVWFAWEVFSK